MSDVNEGAGEAPDDLANPGEWETISPGEIALAAMQGLLASGTYGENPAGAAVMAWQCVFGFQEGARQYAQIVDAMNREGEPPV